jgi:hypothetical protein
LRVEADELLVIASAPKERCVINLAADHVYLAIDEERPTADIGPHEDGRIDGEAEVAVGLSSP